MPFISSLARSAVKLVKFNRNRDVSFRGVVQNLRRDVFDLKVAPALSGYNNGNNETEWNLGTMGALVIDGSNNGTSYTITNLTSRAKYIQMWGQGSSGKGGYSYGTFNLVKDQAYALSLNQGGGQRSPSPNMGHGSGGGYGGLFTGTVDRANSVIISGGGGGNGGTHNYAPGGAGGGPEGAAGSDGSGGRPGGAGGGQSCSSPRYLQGGPGPSGGGGSNWSGGGGGGAGYCGGEGGTTGSDPGGGTQSSGAGGGGSGYINQSLSSDGVTTTYPAGLNDPNRGNAGNGPARIVFTLPS